MKFKKYFLFIVIILLYSLNYIYAGMCERVEKYLYDRGYSNAQVRVDFMLRDDGNGVYIENWNYPLPIPAITNLPSDEESMAWDYQKWQSDKSTLLKIVENNYVTFLTNDWTMILRTNSLIDTNFTVCVTNKTEYDNIVYLLTLKVISKNDYYNMAGEFDRYKTTITSYGGIMSEVIWHSEVAQ